MSKTLTDWVRGTARAENVKFYPRNFDIWAKSHFLPDFDKKKFNLTKGLFCNHNFCQLGISSIHPGLPLSPWIQPGKIVRFRGTGCFLVLTPDFGHFLESCTTEGLQTLILVRGQRNSHQTHISQKNE